MELSGQPHVTLCPLNRMLNRPQSQAGSFGEKINLFPLTWFEHWNVQQQPSLYKTTVTLLFLCKLCSIFKKNKYFSLLCVCIYTYMIYRPVWNSEKYICIHTYIVIYVSKYLFTTSWSYEKGLWNGTGSRPLFVWTWPTAVNAMGRFL